MYSLYDNYFIELLYSRTDITRKCSSYIYINSIHFINTSDFLDIMYILLPSNFFFETCMHSSTSFCKTSSYIIAISKIKALCLYFSSFLLFLEGGGYSFLKSSVLIYCINFRICQQCKY